MKLAYFSPMPPDKTGIATYSHHLAAALREHCDLTVFTSTADPTPLPEVRIVDFVRNLAALKELAGFDQVLYHLGNNPYFHLDILKVFSLSPGPVCLHDTVVYYLAAGLGRGALLNELLLENPREAMANLDAIEASCPDANLLRYATPSRHPCVRGVLAVAPQVIVHNETSAKAMRALGFEGRIDVIPLLHYASGPATAAPEAQQARRALGYSDSDFVIGVFGFIGPTKRTDKVLDALARLRKLDLSRRPRLLIVGEGESLQAEIERRDLQEFVRSTGFVGDDEFASHLAAVDVLANLRYPSHGESSATLVQAMSLGKPSIVTDHGFFAELPDAAVVKVPFDAAEVDVLTERLRDLMQRPKSAAKLGAAARGHVRAVHAPSAVAALFAAALAETARTSATGAQADFDPGTYLQKRITELAHP